jgi:hypothetical protein
VDRAFAFLLVAAQLISPLGWVYYLWLPAGPLAMVAANRTRRSRGAMFVSGLLSVVALGSLLLPPTALLEFQPSRWATIAIASAYFWATISLWGWLMLDFAQSRQATWFSTGFRLPS